LAGGKFSAMSNLLLAESNPVAAVGVVLGVGLFILLWLIGFKWLNVKMSGWNNLTGQFPAPTIEMPGDTFKGMTGWIGRNEFDRVFTMQLLPEGLLVRPSFARKVPILIPWQSISEVQVSDGEFHGFKQNLTLSVACEKQVQFSLPPGALPVVERNIPANRFRKIKIPGSIGELLKDRWKNRNS
jgi:hypothetical protein